MYFTFQPIGILHTLFRDPAGMPIQPSAKNSTNGHAEIFPQFAPGLRDIGGFSHLILIYCFHRQKKKRLVVKPFLDYAEHGVFATRAPSRPNKIGLSVVPLIAVQGNMLHLENLDMLDGTPLLDIKPYIPDFDHYDRVKTGWLEGRGISFRDSDDRFSK